MASFKTIDDLDVRGQRVLLRADLNVPMADGAVSDATRITRLAPTVTELAERGARVVAMSHFGRPKGQMVPEMSLGPVVEALADALGREVAFAPDCVGPAAAQVVDTLPEGGVALLENLRFHAGEEANDPAFATGLAALGDLYVNDAFSASHRAHASIVGLPQRLPAAAGRLLQAEIEALTAALENPARPLMAVVGGAKISTKLALLANLTAKVDLLVIGGGMANTFLHARGVAVGASLCEPDLADTAREVMARAEAGGCEILLPTDAVVAGKLAPGAETRTVAIDAVPDDAMILDVGPDSARDLAARLEDCRSLVWNGPLGAFETPPFDAGTAAVARRAADLTRSGRLLSVAGGGDTVAALAQAGVLDAFSYVSTAGGAFLEWLEGKELPGVAALEAAA
ncbi:MAG: phosphoglycerate kinase [Alphaproteobacteria bacterium]|nr:phosphoglycerate kinase [Alphaproteobacteria bacterium]